MNQISPLPGRRPRKASFAFSLPEVAIAVAIAAVGLVTLLGIIPGGLESVRVAGQTTAEARIASQVLGELQLSDWGAANRQTGEWSNLSLLGTKRWYFDDQANPLSETAASNGMGMRLAYVVKVRVVGPARLTGSTDQATDLQKVQVDIAVTTNSGYDFSRPKGHRTYPSVLARQFSQG